MLSFLKQRKAEKDAANKIGVELHRQIREAIETNEAKAGVRVPTFFTVGYIYGFVRISFTTLGLGGEKMADKYLKHICDGVLPQRLYKIFMRLLAALELAKSLNKEQDTKEFEIGVEVGVYDAGIFGSLFPVKGNNLTKYLLGEELEYAPLPKQRSRKKQKRKPRRSVR